MILHYGELNNETLYAMYYHEFQAGTAKIVTANVFASQIAPRHLTFKSYGGQGTSEKQERDFSSILLNEDWNI